MNTSTGPASTSVMQQGGDGIPGWLVMPAVFLIAGLQTATAGDPLVEHGGYLFTAAGWHMHRPPHGRSAGFQQYVTDRD